MAAGKIIPGTIPLAIARRGGVAAEIPGGLRQVEKFTQPDLKVGEGVLQSRFYEEFLAKLRGGQELTPEQVVKQILFFVEVDFLLKTLNTAFLPRVFSVGTTPVEIIERARSRYPRGYIFLNPAEITGVSSDVTFFASALRAGAAAPGNDFISNAFNVSGVDTVRAFLDITAIVGAPTLRVDAQTQDPLTANWATSQPDIFAGASTVRTFYASLGQLGVDRNIRLLANVTGAATSVTFSTSGLLKGGGTSPVGTTIFIGDRNVNTTIGYRLLPTQKEAFFLRENVEIWAVTALNTQNLMVFDLQ